MSKRIIYDEEARRSKRGAISVTLGQGHNVVLDKKFGPRSSPATVSPLPRRSSGRSFENMGAQLVREAATRPTTLRRRRATFYPADPGHRTRGHEERVARQSYDHAPRHQKAVDAAVDVMTNTQPVNGSEDIARVAAISSAMRPSASSSQRRWKKSATTASSPSRTRFARPSPGRRGHAVRPRLYLPYMITDSEDGSRHRRRFI